MILTNLYEKEGERTVAHDGAGEIIFRRVLEKEFASGINFLDYTIMPPKTEIGYHQHVGTEEVYVVISGSGIMKINGLEKRVGANDVIVASDGDWHGLLNDTEEETVILVFEGKVEK